MRQEMRFSNARRAFTLIELMLVLVILAILAAVVVPKFAGKSEMARKTAAKHDISVIDGALDAFNVDTGRYPTSDEGLAALVQQPGNVQNWNGPYLKGGVPKDPWGHPYVYRYPGTNNPNGCDLYSTGQDGKDSGGNEINNWSQNQK